MKTILVIGGAGYIGSHTCVRLLESGYDVVIMDSLANSLVMDRLAAITSRKPTFVRADIRDRESLEGVFARIHIDAVIHFCGLRAVGESAGNPLDCYDDTIGSTLALCRVMRDYGVRDLVYSSPATTDGAAGETSIPETAPLCATSHYGRTKLMIRQILADLYASSPGWNLVMLRYFNPVGAHPSGLIGEDIQDAPGNLFPCITQVAAGRLSELSVYGGDYPTPDGTGVRDYIHVMDLAEGHLRALEHLQAKPGFDVFNLGTGRGCSVLEAVRTFEAVNGVPVPHRITARRPGDVAVCYADAGKARQVLGWEARLGIEDMVRDAWNWQCGNPGGYHATLRCRLCGTVLGRRIRDACPRASTCRVRSQADRTAKSPFCAALGEADVFGLNDPGLLVMQTQAPGLRVGVRGD